jgi:hypothetical protein
MMKKQNGRRSYTIHNYDAVNKAVEAETRRIVAISSISKYRKYENEARTVALAVGAIGIIVILIVIVLIMWSSKDEPSNALGQEALLTTDITPDGTAIKESYTRWKEIPLSNGEKIVTARSFHPGEDKPYYQYCYIGAFVRDRVGSFSSDVIAHVTNGRREILTEDSLLAVYVTKYCYFDDMGKQGAD